MVVKGNLVKTQELNGSVFGGTGTMSAGSLNGFCLFAMQLYRIVQLAIWSASFKGFLILTSQHINMVFFLFNRVY
jgi:hypothetical protein